MERVTKAKVLGAQDGKAGPLITIGVRFMAWGEETGGTVSIVEHPIPPGPWPHPCTATRARTSTPTW